MTDETPAAPAATPDVQVAPAVASVVSPALEPVVAPVVETTPAAPAVVEPAPAPADAPTVPAETPAEPAAEPAAEGDAPPEEPKPAAPVYAEFKLPEGVVAEAPIMSAYTNVLGKYGIPQEAGQELIDFHATQIKAYGDRLAQQQQDVFAETRQGWVKDFEKLAGNRRDTILNDAKFGISEVVKDKKEQRLLWDMFSFTGAGDHPANIRAWAAVGKRLRERSAPQHGVPSSAAPSDPISRRYGTRKA